MIPKSISEAGALAVGIDALLSPPQISKDFWIVQDDETGREDNIYRKYSINYELAPSSLALLNYSVW